MFRLISMLVFVLIFSLTAFAALVPDEDSLRIVRKAERKYVKSGLETSKYFLENVYVDSADHFEKNLVLFKGDATINGVVEGDILAVKGDVRLKANARVSGNVTTIGGKIYLDNEAEVGGEMLETGFIGLFKERERNRDRHYQFETTYSFNSADYFPVRHDNEFLFGYNRVDGLILGKAAHPDYSNKFKVSGFGALSYAFYRKQWNYKIGLEKWFLNSVNNRLVFGMEGHNMSDHLDSWKINSMTNTLASLLFGEDYFEYFKRTGFSVYSNYTYDPLYVQVAYVSDKYSTLDANPDLWHLFGNNETLFRQNIVLEKEAVKRALQLKLKLSTFKENHHFLDSGWELDGESEISSEALGSNYSFNRVMVMMKRYQKLGNNDMLALRFGVGSSEGNLPDFMQFRSGGFGTIRGVHHHSLSGNRSILFNAEWIFPSDYFEPINFGSNFYYGLFLDSGSAWDVSDKLDWFDGFSDLTWNNLKTNAGVSLKYDHRDMYFQIDFGWDLSRTENSPLVLLRLSPHF